MVNINKTLACAMSDDLVSYLYDEMDPIKTSGFEAHLSDCASCTDEFACLSLARLGVYEWHRDAFRDLNTPFIEIPYVLANGGDGSRSSWLDTLRGVFAPAPKWSVAGGAFAILSIGLGFIFIASNIFRDTGDMAVNYEVESPISNVTDAIAFPTAPEAEHEVAVLDESIVINPAATAAKNTKPTPGRTFRPGLKKAAPHGTKLQAVNRENTVRKPPTAVPPQLSNFSDEEDNTLRLADLFAEVDARRLN